MNLCSLDAPNWDAPDGERRCLVALCHNWPVVYRQTSQSLMELGWGNRVPRAKAAHGFAEVGFAWYTTSPRVDALRDMAALDAVEHGFTHLLFLDADMIWPTDTLDRMLGHHADGIVSGLYTVKSPPYSPVALKDGTRPEGSIVTQYYHDLEALNAYNGLRPEQVVGMGCTIIPVEVFRRIGPRPWFDYANDDAGWPRVSEDVAFCEKARAAGCPVSLAPGVRCGHVTTEILDHRYAERHYLHAAEAATRAKQAAQGARAPQNERTGDEVV